MSKMTKNLLLISLLFLLSACASNKSTSCIEIASQGLQKIDQSEKEKFWSSKNKSGYQYISPPIKSAIINGKYGYVIIEQTIDLEGKIIDLKLIDSYPEDYFVATAIKMAEKLRYSANTCIPLEVRYEHTYSFTNGEENLEKISRLLEARS